MLACPCKLLQAPAECAAALLEAVALVPLRASLIDLSLSIAALDHGFDNTRGFCMSNAGAYSKKIGTID